MRKYLLLILVIIFHYEYSYGQFTYYEVQLKDKNGTVFKLSDPTAYLSSKAISRRLNHKIPIDSTDLPINMLYMDLIRSAGKVTVHTASKWFNTVYIATSDLSALEKIRSFIFVSTIKPIAGFAQTSALHSIVTKQKHLCSAIAPVTVSSAPIHISGFSGLNYGASYNQIHLHHGEYLHNLGFSGEGMLIAVLDGGFYNYKSNPVFDSLRQQNRVVAEFDLVNHETNVNDDGSHGATVLSVLAANNPGAMVGSAPKASYLLLRTENEATETPLEEQNWAAAAEYADSAGADIISSSLGYVNFDNPAFNHTYAVRDGKTAFITLAANKAVKKGLLVMNSAGNSGNIATDERYVSCPADGDSVLAVGAVDSNRIIGSSSSWGPNSSGKIKPDLVSMGINATIALTDGTIGRSSGTSYSNPNLAGLVACLWQAFPEFNNMEIIDAVKKGADKYNSPDNRYGYGIPDFSKISNSLQEIRAARNAQRILSGTAIKAYPVPFADELNVLVNARNTGKALVKLMDITGKTLDIKTINAVQGTYFTLTFQHLDRFTRGIYIIRYLNNQDNISIKVIK